MKLSFGQRALLRQISERAAQSPDGVLCKGGRRQSAEALVRRGLLRVVGDPGVGIFVKVTDEGRAWLKRADRMARVT